MELKFNIRISTDGHLFIWLQSVVMNLNKFLLFMKLMSTVTKDLNIHLKKIFIVPVKRCDCAYHYAVQFEYTRILDVSTVPIKSKFIDFVLFLIQTMWILWKFLLKMELKSMPKILEAEHLSIRRSILVNSFITSYI